jgi:hypothetical protein
MERPNELLGLLDAERIDDRPVPLIDASAFEGRGGVALLGVVAIAEFECAA